MRYASGLTVCATAAIALFSGFASCQGSADAYPFKPVTLIVTTAAGGGADLEARRYSAKMRELLGQPFVVDYKIGAGSTIAAAYVAKAAPDGYTLLAATPSLTVIPVFYKDFPFDIVKDFAPVSILSERPLAFMITGSFPARNFVEYIAHAKANPGKINFGTSGGGGIAHLLGAWAHSTTNTKVTFLHYKGTGPLWPDLLSGRVDVTVAALITGMPQIKTGKLRAVAVTADKRTKLLPDLPTVAEQGIPGFNGVLWQGFTAPGATPATIINKLSEAFGVSVKAPEVIASLEADGAVPVGSTPAQFRQVIAREVAQWQKLIQDTGIKLQE